MPSTARAAGVGGRTPVARSTMLRLSAGETTRAACSVPALMAVTGMPRRTAQDTLAALAELDIDCHFEQLDGERNNAGHYRIKDWGPINRDWIANHLSAIKAVLGYN